MTSTFIPILDFQSERTVSIGKAFGLGGTLVEKCIGPVLAVTGEFDYYFCGSNTPGKCLTGTDSAVAKDHHSVSKCEMI